ncbi:hypothetical protein H0H92_005867, partial [Tricholoma furcatifolium]
MPGHFNSNFLLTTVTLLVILLGISSPVLSLPYPPRTVPIQKQKGQTSGRYTVKLKHGVNVSHFIEERKITNSVTELPFFDSFFAPLQASQLTELSHDPNVIWIAEDGVIAEAVTRPTLYWGLSRLTNSYKIRQGFSSMSTLKSDNQGDGRGVDIYILDSGEFLQIINFAHAHTTFQ